MKQKFVAPFYKIIRFENKVISTSGCCYNPYIPLADDCTADGEGCECGVNYNPALDNCQDPD